MPSQSPPRLRGCGCLVVAVLGAIAVALAIVGWTLMPDNAGNDDGFGGLGAGILAFEYLVLGGAGVLAAVGGTWGALRARRRRRRHSHWSESRF